MDSPLIIGIEGKRASRALVSHLKKINPAGILLLARNIDSPRQLKTLISDINQSLGKPLLWTIDHEGGNVTRFSRGVTSFPSAQALGITGNPDLSYAVGRQMALELSPIGISINFAPVLDLRGSSDNPGIGIRSFGEDPEQVSLYGEQFIRGLEDHHVWACAKHFPGMGEARLDPHLSIPKIEDSRALIFKRHLPPFLAAFKAGVHCVMTSHIHYPALDSKLVTFSKKIVTDLLKKKLGFKGLVISDDLSMGAVLKSGLNPAEAAVQAYQAGHDLLIVSNPDFGLHSRVQEAVKDFSLKEKIDSILSQTKNRHRQNPDSLHGRRLAAWIAQKSVRVLRSGKKIFPLEKRQGPILALFPKLAEVETLFTFEGGPRAPARWLKARLSRWGDVRLVETPVQNKNLGAISSHVQSAKEILFFCFEARRFPGQKGVLELLNQVAADKTTVFLMRGDADLKLIDSKSAVIDMAGDRKSQIEAALKVILK
jgi:beta-glucosidase-like glycosyl hydrolase